MSFLLVRQRYRPSPSIVADRVAVARMSRPSSPLRHPDERLHPGAEHGGDPVKYVVLIYNNKKTWEALPASDRDRVMATHNRLIKELREAGEMLRVDGLTDPMTTKTLRARGGVPVITDGPFSEAKEYLAGAWALDV